jgi:hypothetical protein
VLHFVARSDGELDSDDDSADECARQRRMMALGMGLSFDEYQALSSSDEGPPTGSDEDVAELREQADRQARRRPRARPMDLLSDEEWEFSSGSDPEDDLNSSRMALFRRGVPEITLDF